MASPERVLRADALRNRELLLVAAEQEFAENGLDAPVADIAARAGLGKGTFFRHFATKEDLVAAIVSGRVQALDAVGRRLLAAPDAGEALLAFLTEAADQRQESEVAFLVRASESNLALFEIRDAFFATVDALVTRAQGAGAVRHDVTGSDVVLLMCLPSSIVEHLPGAAPDSWKRYLAIIFDGLRPAGAHPLPC